MAQSAASVCCVSACMKRSGFTVAGEGWSWGEGCAFAATSGGVVITSLSEQRKDTMAEDLILPKTKTKPVWQHFGFEKNDKGEPKNLDEPICKICLKKVPAKGGNTSNLYAHLQKYHAAIAAKMGPAARGGSSSSAAGRSASQISIQEAMAKATKYDRDSRRWKECTDSLTRFIAKEMVSFNTVEKESFKNYSRTLDPRYEPPGRKYISETAIPALYNEVRNYVQKVISEGYYALTTDMWSSVNMTPYMSLTVHLINNDWEMVSKCLQTSFFPEDHTAKNMAEALKEQLQDWQLDPKNLSAITTDNGANIVAAITKVLCWPWVNCFGHNLHLAVNNTLDEPKNKKTIDNTMQRCRSTIGQFSHSWKRTREMHKAQEELGLPENRLITVSYTFHSTHITNDMYILSII